MEPKDLFKVQGLTFGRGLLRAFKIAQLYSPDHNAAEAPLRQIFSSLGSILEQSREFTFGFLNQRVLINKLLTSDSSLAALEAEFRKRDIAAVNFSAGITLQNFKRGLAILITKPEVIEEKGGIKAFLKNNPIEKMTILAAQRQAGKSDDTVFEMDPQAYILAQAVEPGLAASAAPSLQFLLQNAGTGNPAEFTGNPGEILDLAAKATVAVWADGGKDPGETVRALAQLLETMTPGRLLATLPAERQAELAGRPVQEMAAQLTEDMVFQWIAERLSSGETSGDGRLIDAEVLRVWTRLVQSSQGSDRLLGKLSAMVRKNGLPSDVEDGLHEEARWSAASDEQRHEELLHLEVFRPSDFRHLLDYVKDAADHAQLQKTADVVEHYFAALEQSLPDVRAEMLSSAPELLRIFMGPQNLESSRRIAARLVKGLREEPLDWQCHRGVSDCLISLAQGAADQDDFELVSSVGVELERSLARDPAHADCCGTALRSLLAPASGQRLVELYSERHDNAAWTRLTVQLLRWMERQGAEAAFERLDGEPVSAQRLRLIRLIGQLGPCAREVGRSRLTDNRWYVVRNACSILSSLRDPELAYHLAGALRHPDGRVQQAAFTSLTKTPTKGLGEVLAKSLLYLQPHLVELALDQLVISKDPATVEPLEQWMLGGSGIKAGTLMKAVQVLAVIGSERASAALTKLKDDSDQPPAVRKAAGAALGI